MRLWRTHWRYALARAHYMTTEFYGFDLPPAIEHPAGGLTTMKKGEFIRRIPFLWPKVRLFGLLLTLVLLTLVGCKGDSGTSKENTSGSVYKGTELAGPAPDFRLLSHRGENVSLSDFRGKVVVLAFLDPECTDVCPLTANQFRLTAQKLGDRAGGLGFLVVNVNPEKNSLADVARATETWRVQTLTNWHYVTGPRAELEPVYQAYSILAEGPPKPGKPNELEHTPGAYVIDQAGQKRWYISANFEGAPPLNELLVKHVLALLDEKP